ncbi:hypothetical protein D3C80_692580 [compost metagenome]
MTEFVSDDLIPEASLWNNGRGIHLESWIGMNGNYSLAVGYAYLFWPEFVVIDDYVLLPGTTQAHLQGWLDKKPSDRRAIEEVLNHRHIVDMHSGEPVTEAQIRHLGRTLKSIYEHKLGADFSDRNFVVIFNDEDGLDPVEYQLTFWQEPK